MLCPGERINSSERVLYIVCFCSMDMEGKGGQWKLINEIILGNAWMLGPFLFSYPVSTIWLTLKRVGALLQLGHGILIWWPLRVARLNVCAESQADFRFSNTAPTSKSCETFISRLSLDAGNTQPCYQCLFSACCVALPAAAFRCKNRRNNLGMSSWGMSLQGIH